MESLLAPGQASSVSKEPVTTYEPKSAALVSQLSNEKIFETPSKAEYKKLAISPIDRLLSSSKRSTTGLSDPLPYRKAFPTCLDTLTRKLTLCI